MPKQLEWLRQCLKANPNYPVAHFELAAALAHLKVSNQRTAGRPASLYFDLLADFFNRIGQKPTFCTEEKAVSLSAVGL